jgi:hypothetical protein
VERNWRGCIELLSSRPSSVPTSSSVISMMLTLDLKRCMLKGLGIINHKYLVLKIIV